jgi:hypothetical protein
MTNLCRVLNRDEFHVVCCRKSIALFNEAASKDSLSRTRTLWLIVKSVVAEPFFLLSHFFSFIGNFLYLAVLPLSQEVHKIRQLKYRVVRLMVLDPLHFLNRVFIVVLRVTSLFFGLFFPYLALVGIKKAEEMELINLQSRANLRKKYPSSNVDEKREEVCPLSAFFYLGEKISFQLEEGCKTDAEKQILDDEIKSLFIQALSHFGKEDPNGFRKFFQNKKHVNLQSTIEKIGLKNCSINIQTFLAKIAQLSVKEINEIIKNEAACIVFGSEEHLVSKSFVVDDNLNSSTAKFVEQKFLELQISLSKRLGFGLVSYNF